jgi:uncharacterized protein (TIGR00369 family)
MSIWKVEMDIGRLHRGFPGTMLEHLDITIDAVGDDSLTASMPVDHRTIQRMGILHGGASVVLAESVGSIASNCCIDQTTLAAVGLQINANHIRPVRSGRVSGTARPLHLGFRTHVWRITLQDENSRRTCECTLTTSVITRKSLGL